MYRKTEEIYFLMDRLVLIVASFGFLGVRILGQLLVVIQLEICTGLSLLNLFFSFLLLCA